MENNTIKADDIINYCLSNLDDVLLMNSWGNEQFITILMVF